MTRISTMGLSGAAVMAANIIGYAGALADDQKPSLSQQLANPIANLSVPIQYNALFGAGLDKKGAISVLDIQPVIPLKLKDDWNLITERSSRSPRLTTSSMVWVMRAALPTRK